MRLIGILSGFCLFVLLAFSAAAQTAPQGFTTSTANGVWTATSLDQGGGARVKVIYYPVESTSENFLRWFSARSETRAKTFGTITSTVEDAKETYHPPKAPLATHIYLVKTPARADIYVESFAYDTVEGLQHIQMISPGDMQTSNAAYQSVLNSMGLDWAAGTYYKPAVAPASPSAPADTNIPPPPRGKKNCRREPVWGWAVRYGCSPSAVCNERVIKRYEWVCDP